MRSSLYDYSVRCIGIRGLVGNPVADKLDSFVKEFGFCVYQWDTLEHFLLVYGSW